MALAYLLDPCHQFQNRAGVNNVSGWCEVFRMDTDDRAEVYHDFTGTLAPAKIVIDNNGRAPMIVEDGIPYRLEVYLPSGELLYTQQPLYPGAGGGGSIANITSSDGSIDVFKTGNEYDLTVAEADPTVWVSSDNPSATEQYLNEDGNFVLAEGDSSGTALELVSGTLTVRESGWFHVSVNWSVEKVGSTTNEYREIWLLVNGERVGESLDLTKSRDVVWGAWNGDLKLDAGDTIVFSTDGLESDHKTAARVDKVSVHKIAYLVSGGGHEYTGGTGIIVNNVTDTVSVDLTTVQGKLTAGSNIVIDGDTISATAEPQEQADWNQSDSSEVDYIKNKPDISGMITTALSDYTPTASLASVALSGDYDDLQDKPDLSVYATTSDLTTGLAGKQDTISDLSDIRSGAALGATAVQPAALNDYATTSAMNTALAGKQDTITAGNGIDITNDVVSAKVDGTTIGINSSGELAVQGSVGDIFIATYGTTTLADIYDAAAAGKAVFLKNPNPSYPYGLIPMYELFWPSGTGKFARFVSPLWGATTEYMPSDTKSYAIAYTVGSSTGWHTDPRWTLPETQQADNGKVLTAYNNGTTSSVGWASIPVTDVEVGGSSVVNAQGVAEVPAQVNADWNSSSGASEILNKPSLATVATSGDYDDLTNKPTIPAALSAGNGIDITSNVVSVDLDGSTLTNGANGLSVTLPVPAVTSSDDGKVLTADYTGGVASYSWETPSAGGSRIVTLTVDTSTWADFTAAYAQLTAGTIDGIRAKLDSPSMGFAPGYCYYADLVYVYKMALDAPVAAYFSAPSCNTSSGNTGKRINSVLYVLDANGWTTTNTSALASNIVAGTGVSVSTDASYNIEVAVSDPLPAHTSTESGKVLSVGATGATVWVTPASAPVTDVEVDGVSVVSSGVASITMPTFTQAQANWNESDTSAASYIQNKPNVEQVYYVTYGTTTWSDIQSAYAANNDVRFVLKTSSGVVDALVKIHEPTSNLGWIQFNKYEPTQTGSTIVETVYRLSFDNAWSVRTVYNYAAVQSDWNESDTGSLSYIQNRPSIPSATSDLTNDSGFITLSDVPAQVNADWNSSSGASEILNKPTIPSGTQLVPTATSADADKVLTVDSQGTPAWASAQAPISAGNGIDITNNVVSVDTSVVATQTDLTGKEDAFDVGTGLEMDTSGSTPTLQVEAPVDIVAGPGIVIDNPDGNTLRVSTLLEWQDKSSEISNAKTGTKLLYMPATGLCMLTIIWAGNVTTNNAFGTISSDYRPSTSIITCAAMLNNNNYCRAYVESNGNITLSTTASATNVGVRITAMWIAGK